MFALLAVVALLAALVPLAASQAVGPAIVLSRSSAPVTEGAASASYTVALATPSPAAVVVTISGGAGDVSATPATLTFPAGSTAPQSVVLAASDDAAVEGTESLAVLHTATSDDPAYNGRSASLAATVTDNDVGVVLLHGGTDATATSVAEAGAQDTLRVALGAAPSANVVVRLTPDPQLSLATLTLTFTPSDWKNVRSVAIAAANDQVAQGTRTKLVSALATSTQAAYDGRSSSLQATILDNDVAGYLFTGPGQANLAANTVPTLAFAEGGESSFTLRLTSQPVAPVTVNLGGTSGATTVPSSLVFNAASWSTPQAVRVLRAQDLIDQGETYLVTATLATSTTDANYAAIPGSVGATITDDDLVGLQMAHTGADTVVREGGVTDTFTVALVTQPRAGVTLGLTAPAGITLDPASLTFDGTTWSSPRSVTVRAVDDAIASLPRSIQVTATAASGDALYQGLTQTLPVRVLDDDGVLIIQEEAGTTRVTEGGAGDFFTVRLIGEPDKPVTVTLTASDGGQFTVNGAASSTLTFDPGTGTSVAAPCSAQPTTTCRWDAPQSVQVAAVADHRIDGLRTGTIALATGSADPDFDAQGTRPVGVTVVDTDVAALVFNGAAVGTVPSLTVTEGGLTSYTVRLSSIPAGTVTVGLTGSNGAVATPASLTFDATSWNTARSVNVHVARDQVDQGAGYSAAVANVAASGADANFAGLSANVPVAVADHPDDIAGWLFSAPDQAGLARDALPSLSLAEGQSVAFTVRLNSKPTANVVLQPTGQSGVTAAPASLTFTAANWDQPKSVVVTATADAVDRGTSYGASVAQAATSGDAMYGSVPGPVAATVTDDDVAALLVTPTGGSTVVQEGGATDVFHAVLASQPAATVTLTLTHQHDLTLSATQLTFGPATWNVPQAVTVTAVDDSTPESPEGRSIGGLTASTDPLYSNLVSTVRVTVLDNDGVLLVQPTGDDTTVEEGGATDTYTVRLVSDPDSRVTVTVSSSGQLLVNGGSTATLTFEPGSGSPVPARCPDDSAANCQWDNPQVVTLTAIDDTGVEGSMVSILQHAVASDDDAFDGVPSASLQAQVVDNDRGLLLVPTGSGTSVVEDGASDTYAVTLSVAPSFSVAVLVEVPAGLTATPDTLFFDAETWAIPQTVTLTAVDDDVDQGTRVLQVAHATSSADDAFHGLTASLAVTVVDDD